VNDGNAASLRVMVVGCGSIGLRHAANLRTLGVERIVAVDPDAARRRMAAERLGVAVRAGIDEALADGCDLTVVATPPAMHVPVALTAAKAGSHLFIEKPLSHTMEGVAELTHVVAERGLVGMVACNMRFHHGPATIKRLLGERAVGTVVSALLDAGQYLPDWHPEEDHTKSYSAREELGGGVVLDGIHELDYVRWLFGEVRSVAALTSRRARLGIATESAADLLIGFASGVNATVHVDYVQRAYARACKVIGDEGTITWDITTGDVRCYRAPTRAWETFTPPPDHDINDMYVAEMRHLLGCLTGGTPELAIPEAARVLEIALAARASASDGRVRIMSGAEIRSTP
jgi:predicted dehydrogenase